MEEERIAEIVKRVLSGSGNASDGPGLGTEKEDGGRSRNGFCTDMTLQRAVSLIERVERRAEELGMRVVTAVSDGAGRPVAIHRMDGAYIGSFDVALNKAFTSVAFQMSTEELGKLAAPGASLYGIQFTNEGKIVIFGGGEPLYAEGKLIGAVGISGGTAEQDTTLAAYAGEIFKEVISCP